MTTFEIDLNFKPVTTAVEVLNTLCFEAAMGIEEYNLSDVYANIFIPVSKSVTIFAEVRLSTETRQPIYFVTSSKNQAAEIQSMSYRQAVSKLNLLLAS